MIDCCLVMVPQQYNREERTEYHLQERLGFQHFLCMLCMVWKRLYQILRRPGNLHHAIFLGTTRKAMPYERLASGKHP